MAEKDINPSTLLNTDLEQCRLADAAYVEFNSENYELCLENLSKLKSTKESEKKIVHNKAVVDFYRSGLKNYNEFRKSLDDIIGEMPNLSTFDIKDLSLAIPLLNKAIILFQLRQSLAALKIVLVLLKHLDAFDTEVAQKIGLLAIQLVLNLNQPKKAEAIITLLKIRLSTSSDLLSISDEDDEPVLDKNIEANRAHKPLDEFRWMFRLYKMRSKVMNEKTILIPTEETPEMLVLKAHQYYIGHDYQMAAKELSKKPITALSDFMTNGEDYNTIVANNMGLIHFHVRHYAMAVRFFQHALQFDQKATESLDIDAPIHAIGASKQPEILYNLGIAMLHLQRPKEAFECFLVPLNYYHNNPKLWLRLAEACIMVHKENLKSKERKTVVSSVIGSGLNRKYVIQPTPPKHVSDPNESFAIPNTNLEFASLCLRNALALVEHIENDFIGGKPDSTSKLQQNNERTQCNPSKALSYGAFLKLKYAVLAAYSYVQISLGEYLLALKYAQELLKMPNLPDPYAILGHLYCAESLIMLDRCHEARAYLEPKFIGELKEDDFIQWASPDWNINSRNAARAVLEYNLSVLLVLQGENELAIALLKRCKHPIVINHLKMLTIYLEMQVGNLELCRKMIRIDTPQYY
ncbi:CCR4-NOT transcription complex subunit 10 [Contarinia nasturtii]|uniref:CCR4-NOT transcription complex subunit 10 n=1 Tax=Contarinia nasturtii TaxID=265458 RepID=UPI0012D44B55|nr:CCR4-NOT transcription complex subunit 10 [Contarinia nasturtii]